MRRSEALGFLDNPERETSLETLIELVGGNITDFPGKTACCGFPILFINQANSMKMVANHTGTAKDLGADAMVTPCPLCHLNLDGYQPKARRHVRGDKADLPVIPVPPLIGLATLTRPDALGDPAAAVRARAARAAASALSACARDASTSCRAPTPACSRFRSRS